MYARMDGWIDEWMYVHNYECIHTCVCVCAHMYNYESMHAHVCTYMHEFAWGCISIIARLDGGAGITTANMALKFV